MAPTAFAQIYGGGYGSGLGSRGILGGGGIGYGGGFGGYGGYTSNMGTVQGSVASLDFERGRLTMRTTQGLLSLNARPQDLVGLNPGDVAAITFLNYDGARWLEPGGGYGGSFGGGFGTDFGFHGEVTGTVQRVDRQRGLVQIAGRTLRAHPEDVSDVYPGQFISVGYVQVGKTAWADSGIYGGGGLGIYGGGGGYGGGIYGGGRYGTGLRGRGGGGWGGNWGGIYQGGQYGGDVGEVERGATSGDATGESGSGAKQK